MNERTARWLAPATAVLAVDIVLLVALGPLLTGVIDYRVGSLLRHQLIGADLVSLAVLAPLTLLAARLIRNRSCAGPLLALGTALTTWYLAAELVLGPDRSGQPGNDEAFLPLFLGVLLLASAVAIGSWRALPGGSVFFDRPTRIVVGWLLLLVVTLLVLRRYLPAWLSSIRAAPPADYLAGPEVWWAVAFEDLVLLLPAAAATGIGLLRGSRWAGMAAFAAAGCLGLVGLAVVGMAWSASLHGDPGATTGSAWVMTGVGLATALPALLCWTAVVRTGRQNLPHDEPDPGTAPPAPRARPATTPAELESIRVPTSPTDPLGEPERLAAAGAGRPSDRVLEPGADPTVPGGLAGTPTTGHLTAASASSWTSHSYENGQGVGTKVDRRRDLRRVLAGPGAARSSTGSTRRRNR